MSVASRVPAFLLLGLVFVATALLIAGYGLPVGIGVITGLLLGSAVVLAFLGLSSRSRGGAGFTWLSPDVPANQPDHELIQRHGRDSMRVAGVDAGALRRVIPLGDAVEAGGTRVELVALEIREDGAIATLVAHTRPPGGPSDISSRSRCPTMQARPTSPRARVRAARALEPAATRSASRPRRQSVPGH